MGLKRRNACTCCGRILRYLSFLIFLVLAITRHIKKKASRAGGSVGNILRHLPDVTNADALTLIRALSLELGCDVANQYGARLYQAFCQEKTLARDNKDLHIIKDIWNDDSSPESAGVDARYVVATFKAALLAASAFHHPKSAFLKLTHDFTIDCINNNGIIDDINDQWFIADILRVVSIAAVTDDGVDCTAGLLEQSIKRLATESWRPRSIVTADLLMKALDSTPCVMQNFRSQMVSKLSSEERLKILAREEVGPLRVSSLKLYENV